MNENEIPEIGGDFDPKKYLIQLKGKWYLETKWRIRWFRQDHPTGTIATEVVSLDPPLVKATIYASDGHILATGHAGANDKGNAVWSGRSIEKSETAAIGRALASAGYGTQFTGDEMDDGQADGGNTPRQQQPQRQQQRQQPSKAPTVTGDLSAAFPRWDKTEAEKFVAHWRKQSISDADLLKALGVARLGDWAKDRKAADEAVSAWLNNQLKEAV